MLYNTNNQWVCGLCLRLILFKRTNRVGVSLLSNELGERSNFCKYVLSSYLEFRTSGIIYKSSASDEIQCFYEHRKFNTILN
jgi:hypothetical protein